MAKTWLRITDKNLELDDIGQQGFFTMVQRLKAFGDTYVLTRNNANTGNYFPNPIINNVDYDFGMMALPAGAKRLWYTLNDNGLLDPGGLDLSNGQVLQDDFFGMVLCDIQPTGQVSPFFAGAMGLDINLCKDYNWDIEPAWGAHHHCAAKFSNSQLSATSSENMAPTSSEPPIFWIPQALLANATIPHPGHYLIPFLMPEKIVAYYAVLADTDAYQRINQVWFQPMARYMDLYQTQTQPFIAVEVDEHAYQRSDEYLFHFVLEPDATSNPTLALACVSKQNNDYLIF